MRYRANGGGHLRKGRYVAARSRRRLRGNYRWLAARRGGLMLHVDDAHDRAETILKEFLSDKPRSWRILLIKDLFARLRIVLWCPKSHWEAACEEIDQGLRG